MLERYIHYRRVERPPEAETATEARVRLREHLPRSTLRRMTHLGLLTGAALEGVTFQAEDAIVYATTYAETRALEDFLTSFPAASPLLFQTSIHPSAVQQVLIGRQQPIRRFWPVTGQRRLVESALLAALLEPAPRVVLVGGEERGTWLLEHHLASAAAFACALVLTLDATAALGSVRFQPEVSAPESACASLPSLAAAVAAASPLAWQGAGGAWSLQWS